MWGGNPILITVLFGIPCILMSCILYAICCGEIADLEDEEEGKQNSITNILVIDSHRYFNRRLRK